MIRSILFSKGLVRDNKLNLETKKTAPVSSTSIVQKGPLTKLSFKMKQQKKKSPKIFSNPDKLHAGLNVWCSTHT